MSLLIDASGSRGQASASVSLSLASVTVTAADYAPTADTVKEVVTEQAAAQAALDAAMPGYLLLFLGGVLLFLMMLAHPRFLARLFASLHKKPKSLPRTTEFLFQGPHHAVTSADERVVSGGDLTKGWFLRKGPSQRPVTLYELKERDDPFADPSPSLPPPPAYIPPPHMTPITHNLPFSGSMLWAPFARLPYGMASSVTLARTWLIVGYIGLSFVALIYRTDYTTTTAEKGTGNNFQRAGFAAVAQYPVLIALGVKGNLLGLCVGMGYERIKIFHKLVGRAVFVCTMIHVMCWIKKWVDLGDFVKTSAKPFAVSGFVAFGALCLIAISSLPWIRNASYGLFKICHIIGMFGVLIGTAIHVDKAVPFCVAGFVIYGTSIVSSLTKTRLAHAELMAFPDSSTTIVAIPGITTGWRAGQHIRIRVPALGWKHGTESHPFTIASAPDTAGVVLMCKNSGDWTSKLLQLASRENSSSVDDGPRTATVIVEGPYGGFGNTLIPSFSSVMLVAGGSGISHAISIAHDLVTRAPTGVVRARTVDLIWIVKTEDAARFAIDTLVELVNDAKLWEVQCIENRRRGGNKSRPLGLRVKIYVSRCPLSSPLSLLPFDPFASPEDEAAEKPKTARGRGELTRQPSEAEKEKHSWLQRNPSSGSGSSNISRLKWLTRNPSSSSTASSASYFGRGAAPLSGISAIAGKPVLPMFMDSLVDETISRHVRSRTDASGLLVSACGPGGLVADVRDATRALSERKRAAVGGVELEEEFFGF